MCGIIGISSQEEIADQIYNGLISLQHRGQDSAGIITYKTKLNIKKGKGLVQNIFNQKNIKRLKGNLGIGHTRYSTVGSGQEADIQPFYYDFPIPIALAHNGNLTNFPALKEKYYIQSECDAEAILHILTKHLTNHKDSQELFKHKFTKEEIFAAVDKTIKEIEGSYSIVCMIPNQGLLAFRDPHGIKPLVFGKKQENHIFASETTTLDSLNYEFIDDVKPGEAIFISSEVHRNIINQKTHHPCVFEYIYFARPDSVLDNTSVQQAREKLGHYLAEDCKDLDIDTIGEVPEAARPSAIGLAKAINKEYNSILIRNQYIGRTFIQPNQKIRTKDVSLKLTPSKKIIENKNILIVDDSIVRGNTSRKIIEKVRGCNPKKIYFCSSAPPLKYPCPYGIDMQTKGEFIATKKTIKEIKETIKADTLIYQDIESLYKATNKKTLCAACFTGEYPTNVSPEALEKIEQERKESKSL